MKTGAEYLDSIRDGRSVFLAGRKVSDVASEAAFQASAKWIAREYDRWYLPEADAYNPMLNPPRSVDDLRDRLPLNHDCDPMLELTYQTLMALGTAAGRLENQAPALADRIRRYVDESRMNDIRIVECITDAKGDRKKSPANQVDVDSYLHVVSRDSSGVVIRGAKLHISGAALAHDLLVMPTKAMKPGEEEYAITCAVPANAEGLHIVNVTYAPVGEDTRRYPVSSHHSLADGFVVFDDVFVPHDRVFLDGQVEFASLFAHSLGLWERLGGTAMMADQADGLVGLAHLIAEANGIDRIPHIRDKIAEMLIHATMIRAGLEAAILHAGTTDDGSVFPDELFTNAAKYQAATGYSLMVRHLHDIAGGSVFTAPSLADLENEVVGKYLHKYLTAAAEVSGEQRMRIFHTIRDLTADALGGWNSVVALQSGGGLHAQRLVARKHYDMDRAVAVARKWIYGADGEVGK